ncbi:MAG TPA: S-methyl-5-thioribose-1-phosphate isomerase [Bacillota bacterium]|nr:S-methyl-5-thioribose-1-phosphate isomerase [Bacillota bacterium]
MRTVFWEQGEVVVIDQRRLPQTLEYKRCNDYRQVAVAIKDMLVRGAPAIGATAAYGMALAAKQYCGLDRREFLSKMEEASKTLAATRPTAVNLFWALKEIERVIELNSDKEPVEIYRMVLDTAEKIAGDDIETNRKIGEYGSRLVPPGANILTHCNTGSLATVEFGTALGVIRAAHRQGKNVHVFVDETRPRLQGARLTAWELVQDNIPATLIPDSASGMLMKDGRVDLVLVGADRIALNGDTANKIGTYNVAVIARENHVPFYVVAPTTTIDFDLENGDQIIIEERDRREVTHIDDMAVAPEGVGVFNPAFDVTPEKYITAIITEMGIIERPLGENLRRLKQKIKREG